MDGAYRQAAVSGVDLEAVLHRGAETAAKLCSTVCLAEFDALMASGILEPKALGVVGNAGQALAKSPQSPPKPLGRLGCLRALRDPEIRQAIGFAMTFAKQFGRALEAPGPGDAAIDRPMALIEPSTKHS